MNIVNGNPNIYYVHERIEGDDDLYIKLYPIIAFAIDAEYQHKAIALNLGEVDGTFFDVNLKVFISQNGVRKPPKEYLTDYTKDGLTVYISEQCQEFIGVISNEKTTPTEVTIVEPNGNSLTSSLGVEVYISGGCMD